MRFPLLRIVGMLPAQIRQATGEIQVPPEARSGGYDLVVIGSPTWWFRVSIPIRSYLRSPAANAVLGGTAFAGFSTSRRYWKHNVGDIKRFGEQAGGRWIARRTSSRQATRSSRCWPGLAPCRASAYLDRILGLPPTNLQDGFEAQARRFATVLADRALPSVPPAAAEVSASQGGDG